MSHMMMNGCGVGMMLVGGLGVLLGLTLLVSLIVLVWVVIGRLRRDPPALPAGRSTNNSPSKLRLRGER